MVTLADIRPATEADMNFVINSWLKTQRDVGHHAYMSNPVYFGHYRDQVVAKLAASTTTIACEPEHPEHIFGYIVRGDGCIHMLYVKHDFRKLGIARQLVETTGGLAKPQYVTEVRTGWETWRSKYGLVYDPREA